MHMNRKFLTTLAFGAAFAALGASAHEPTSNAAKPGMEPKAMDMKGMKGDAGSMELHKSMMEQHGKPAGHMTGDVDRDFAAMMIEHHQQALRMAEIEIRTGRSAPLKAMAQAMKDQQTKEIAELAKYK